MCLNKALGWAVPLSYAGALCAFTWRLWLGEQAKFTSSTAPGIQTFQNYLNVDSRLSYFLVVIGVCEYMLVSDLNSVNVILWFYN